MKATILIWRTDLLILLSFIPSNKKREKYKFQPILGLMCWFPRGYWQLENELYVVGTDSTEYCPFPPEYSNDIWFDCSDLFFESAFVNLKAKFKRVMFALAAEKQKSGKKCTNSTFLVLIPVLVWEVLWGRLLIFGLSTLVGTMATKFLWSTSVVDG